MRRLVNSGEPLVGGIFEGHTSTANVSRHCRRQRFRIFLNEKCGLLLIETKYGCCSHNFGVHLGNPDLSAPKYPQPLKQFFSAVFKCGQRAHFALWRKMLKPPTSRLPTVSMDLINRFTKPLTSDLQQGRELFRCKA